MEIKKIYIILAKIHRFASSPYYQRYKWNIYNFNFQPTGMLHSGLQLNVVMFFYIHSSKKVTQHDFDRLYFCYSGFLFIKLDIPRKPVYLPFD